MIVEALIEATSKPTSKTFNGLAIGLLACTLASCGTSYENRTVPVDIRSAAANTIQPAVQTTAHQAYASNAFFQIQNEDDLNGNDSGNEAILNVRNYSAVLSNVLYYINAQGIGRIEPRDQSAIVKTTLTPNKTTLTPNANNPDLQSLTITDALVFEDIKNGFNGHQTTGTLTIEAVDGSFIKINADTDNTATYMTTIATKNLVISLELLWADLHSA